MSTTTRLTAAENIEYPETDGEPMAENTVQYDWITKIKGNLERIYRDDPNVFIAGDLFWYPVEKDNKTRRAPDVLVAFGRPKGPRQSYLQWLEDKVAPQVVFEILSPSNRGPELALKFAFYETFGVEEYYIYDPDFNTLEGWLRKRDRLTRIEAMNGWISPRMGIRFDISGDELRMYRPDGQPFLTEMELDRQADAWRHRAENETHRANEEQRRAHEEQHRANAESRRADAESCRADEEQRRADEEQRRADRLAAQLKALGIEPEP
jgi:Uma2 family endonuclease